MNRRSVCSISPSPPSPTITSALSGLTLPYCLRSRFSASLASGNGLATKAIRSKPGADRGLGFWLVLGLMGPWERLGAFGAISASGLRGGLHEHGPRGVRLYDLSLHCRGGGGRL